jgi:diaminopimelate decarboxylase
MIEPGTALVADTGFYYCRVISIKDLPSHSLVFVAGSAQCIGSIGSSLSYRARAQPTDSESRRERKLIGAKVVGYTCIERDVLNHNFNGRVAVGDYLCFTNVGSYSVVMKPQFIQLAPPVYLLRSNGDISTLRRAETLSDLTTTYLLQGI